MILTAAAALVSPIAFGMLIGVLLRRFRRGRFVGVIGGLGCLLLPVVLAVIVAIRFPIVGLWDAATEGFLCGIGILLAAHRLYVDPRNALLTAGSVVASFLFLEVGARLFLGPPPAYPIGDGPYFLLSSVLRTTGPDSPMFHRGEVPRLLEETVMRGDPEAMAMVDRPPSAMVTKEIVCSIVYGSAYTGLIDVSREREAVFPEQVTARPGATRRVLHIGDSMVFGANVPRGQTFVDNLERLEPEAQHINAGISGMAPDDYLVVLRSWIARGPVDLAVIYLFAGNDMVALDAPHPCSNWESILAYDGGHARLRFPSGPRTERSIGLQWLFTNTPLPYLLRVMIAWNSAAAAFVGSALTSLSADTAEINPQAQFDHLEAILRSARDELRERQIPFVVVVLPHSGTIGQPDGPSEQLSTGVRAIAEKLDLVQLDATDVVREALARGENPIQPDRSHFNEEGHWLMANWLHGHLAAVGGPLVK